MAQALIDLVTYPCPRCGVGLETTAHPEPAWHRCPRCGQGGLPPYPSDLARRKLMATRAQLGPEVLVIGDDAMEEPAIPWFGTRQAPPPTNPSGGTVTQGLLTGVFAVCLALFVITLFLGSNFTAGLFGVVAGVVLLILVRPSNPSPRPPVRRY